MVSKRRELMKKMKIEGKVFQISLNKSGSVGLRFPHPHCREVKDPWVGKLLLNGKALGSL